MLVVNLSKNRVIVTRGQILTIGPVLLVAACYAIAPPVRSVPSRASLEAAVSEFDDNQPAGTPFPDRCLSLIATLTNRLGTSWTFQIHEPFVLGSSSSAQQLEQHYRGTIEPTARALSQTYFRSAPIHPIVILICSNDQQFRDCNLRLDDRERDQFSGIYSRNHRRLIVNISTGEGTLAHELTHALAHADFPKMPEWFDEGLASLHEECEFSDDGMRLIGNPNWRCQVALASLERGELRMLEDLASRPFGLPERANTDYAHVRSFCLFLQHEGLLESFYRISQANANEDLTGLKSLCKVVGETDPRRLDDRFRAWLMAQPRP